MARLKLERDVRDPCVKWAKDHGWLHIRLHFGRGAARGWPDDIFVKRSRVVFVEFKRPNERPTKIQDLRGQTLLENGADYFWTNDVAAFKSLMWGFC